MPPVTGRDSDKFMLRLPTGMREEIKRLATEDGRSMNAQILKLLKFALDNSGLDIDEILRLGLVQRQELKAEIDQTRSEIVEVKSENKRLRHRLDLWEPLILQATSEELDSMRNRLVKFQAVLEGENAGEALNSSALPIDDISIEFPSLVSVQKFIEKIRNHSPEK